MTKTYTDEQKNRAKEIYATEQRPIKDVVTYLECTAPTATRILRSLGVTIRPRGRVTVKKAVSAEENTTKHLSIKPTGVEVAVEEAKSSILNKYNTRTLQGIISNG